MDVEIIESHPKQTENNEEKRMMLLLIGYVRILSKDTSQFSNIIHLIYSFHHKDTTISPPPQPMNIDTINPSLSSTSKSHKNASKLIIDPSELLIFGYVRSNQPTISIEIADLICDFYFRMNSQQSFVWKITNKKRLLSKILHSDSNNKGFESDVFCIKPNILYETNTPSQIPFSRSLSPHHIELDNLSLKWYLKLYPSLNGQFEIEIILISLPSVLKNILFFYQIYCHELSSCWSSQICFNDSDETKKCISSSTTTAETNNILASSLFLDDINQDVFKSLTFYCNFDIIRVGMDKNSLNSKQSSRRSERRNRRLDFKYNPSYYFDESAYLKQQIDGKNEGKFMMNTDKFRFKYNLNMYLLNDLCRRQDNNEKCVISDVYYNMWCLSMKQIKNTQRMSVGVALCALPSNISSIVVQIKLECLQLSLSWSVVRKFDYNERHKCVNDGDICLDDLKKILANNQKLTIYANIVVIEAFDQNKEEMSLIQRQQQQQKKLYPDLSVNAIKNTKNYDFVPMVVANKHFQHICICENGQFEEISQEELRMHDIAWNNLSNMPKKDASKCNNRLFMFCFFENVCFCACVIIDLYGVSTKNYKFSPQIVDGKKSGSHLFQHICIGSKFANFSNEELYFADRYGHNVHDDKSKKLWKDLENLNMQKWAFNEEKNEENDEWATPFNKDLESAKKINKKSKKNQKEIGVIVGDRIEFSKDKLRNKRGTVKFVGGIGGKDDVIGVELERRMESDLVSDGMLKGKKYFHCLPKTGVFIERKHVTKIISAGDNDDDVWGWNDVWGNESEQNVVRNEEMSHDKNIHDEVKELKEKMDGMMGIVEKMTKLMEVMCDGRGSEQKQSENDVDTSEMKELLKGLKGGIDNVQNGLKCDDKVTKKKEFERWFKNKVGLMQYYQLFIDHGFEELSVVRELNMTHLEQIGIKKLGHRIKIQQEIAKLSAILYLNDKNN